VHITQVQGCNLVLGYIIGSCRERGRASVQSLGRGGDAEVWGGDDQRHMGW
jgi:hypothetical protein